MIETFGPDRCLWGSDWPVVNVKGGDLPNWIDAFRTIIAAYSNSEQAAMAHGTAEKVYGVSSRTLPSKQCRPPGMPAGGGHPGSGGRARSTLDQSKAPRPATCS